MELQEGSNLPEYAQVETGASGMDNVVIGRRSLRSSSEGEVSLSSQTQRGAVYPAEETNQQGAHTSPRTRSVSDSSIVQTLEHTRKEQPRNSQHEHDESTLATKSAWSQNVKRYVSEDELHAVKDVLIKNSFRELTSLKALLDQLVRLTAASGSSEQPHRDRASSSIVSVPGLLKEALEHACTRRVDGKVAVNLSALTEASAELESAIETLEVFIVAAYETSLPRRIPSMDEANSLKKGRKGISSLSGVSERLATALKTGMQSSALVSRSWRQLRTSDCRLESKIMERSCLLSIIESLEILYQMRCLNERVQEALHARHFDEANRLCKVFDLLHRASMIRVGLGTVVRTTHVFRSFSESFVELAARSLQHMYEQVHTLCFAFDADKFQNIWTAYESLGAELVLAERFAQAYEHLLLSIRAWIFGSAQKPKASASRGSEREDVDVKPERLLDSRATTTPSISSAAKPEQQPSSSMQSTRAGDLTEPCTELDILSSNPFTILDSYAGLISAVCFSVWHLFEHPLVSKGFRAIVWTSFVARLQEDSIFLTKRLRAQQRTGHLISPVELWRSLLALHALSVQWDCLAQLEQTKEDETASWENPESVEILPRQVNSVRAAAECSTTQLAFSADTKWPASRPRNQVTEQCTLPLASTYREFVKTLVYDYVEQYKRDIESRFTEIFQSEKEWQIVAVHIHNETDVSSTSQSTQTFLREELWQSYLEMAHKWYTIDATDCESSLVIRVLKHDVARMRPKDLLNTIWERLQFDESLVLPDDYTFTSESVFVLECLSVLASMLYAPTNLGTDSVPGLCASAVEEIARYSMYLLAAIYAPCFVTSGILSGSMAQLEKREAMHPPLSAYQQALLDRLLSEQSAVGDAGSTVRRPRSEFHLGKFCCAIESAWTIGQVAALTLDMGVTFQERMLSIEPYESSWRYAFVQRALRMANHLRGLADALRLALYRSVAAPLMDSNSIVRNVTQTLIQKRSWWQSFAAGNANSLQGNAADETHQRTTGATRKDNATVTVTKASSYVNQITGRVRSLRQAAGIPAHAEDIFWRSCVVAALMAVQEGVGLIPAADIDIQIVSQALFDAKTLIAELEEELGFHPLPHASDLCQYIQIHLAPLPRILQWIAPRRETLSRSAVNGLVLHGVRLSTDDETAVKAFTEEAIAHLLHETLAAGNRVGDGDGVDQVSDSASNADETPVSVMSFDAI